MVEIVKERRKNIGTRKFDLKSVECDETTKSNGVGGGWGEGAAAVSIVLCCSL